MAMEDSMPRCDGRRLKRFLYSSEDFERVPLLGKAGSGTLIPKRYTFSFTMFIACSLAVSFNMNLSIAIVSMIDRDEKFPGNFSEISIRNVTPALLDGQGPVIPVITYLLARWIPVNERSFHIALILSGYGVGSFLAVIVSGVLCGSTFLGGWPSVFYAGGLCGLLWCICGAYAMYETPDDHPTISKKEREYIQDHLEGKTYSQISPIPWKNIATSVPFWALAIGFFGQFWLLGFFSTVHAVYMGTVLELPVVENGELSCLPHLLRAVAAVVCGYPIDMALKRKMVSVGFVRKGATAINTVVSCLAFVGTTMVGRDPTANAALFVLGGVLGEFVTFGVCMGCMDIAPDLTGTVSGIINIIGVFPFFMIPALVGWITNYEKSIYQWKKVFYATIGVVACTTLIFVIFGDLNPQPWGTAPKSEVEEEEENESEEDKRCQPSEKPVGTSNERTNI